MTMEVLFTTDYKSDRVFCVANWGILPSIKQIDEMIATLQNIRARGDDDIRKNNRKRLETAERRWQPRIEPGKESTHKIPGYIYVIKSREYYKIGRAKDFRSRKKTYITENPFGIRVVIQKEVQDYISTEKYLLDFFHPKRVRGEWFELDSQDIKWIRAYLKLR